MFYTIVGWVGFVAIVVFVGLPMLPYLLYKAWVNRIAFKKKGRGLDLDLVEPKPAE